MGASSSAESSAEIVIERSIVIVLVAFTRIPLERTMDSESFTQSTSRCTSPSSASNRESLRVHVLVDGS